MEAPTTYRVFREEGEFFTERRGVGCAAGKKVTEKQARRFARKHGLGWPFDNPKASSVSTTFPIQNRLLTVEEVRATSMRTVAALYVMRNGAYFNLQGVEPYDERRDARSYAGPHPVIAHPPCARWGRYWFGGPSAKVRRKRGDDGGLFAHALRCVRTFGGILEHPAFSSAWEAFGIAHPPKAGGWVSARDAFNGLTCCVYQGHYGHFAQKATWLYLVGVPSPPELVWGPTGVRQRMDQGFHTREERRRKKAEGVHHSRRTGGLIHATPEPFREVLVGLARLSVVEPVEGQMDFWNVDRTGRREIELWSA